MSLFGKLNNFPRKVAISQVFKFMIFLQKAVDCFSELTIICIDI